MQIEINVRHRFDANLRVSDYTFYAFLSLIEMFL
jgi:hypothetical protein